MMATKIRLWAERRAGELLDEMEPRLTRARNSTPILDTPEHPADPAPQAPESTKPPGQSPSAGRCDFARRLTVEDLLP